MFPILILVHVLLILCAPFSIAIGNGIGGQNNCPCLEDVPPLAQEDEVIAESFGIKNITNYGMGCSKHDVEYKYNLCSGTNNDTATWCTSEFCYVDPMNCDRPNRKSLSFPNSPRYFSFETCGYVDDWSRDPNTLRGKVLQGVLSDNHRGYEGSILIDGELPYNGKGIIIQYENEQYYGSVVDLVNHLVHDYGLNFTINFTVVPEDVANTARSYQPFIDADEDFTHVDCVYATGTSDIDLCIGAFTKNRHRSGISSFLEMGVTAEYLIVSSSQPETPGQLIAGIFAPFSPALWMVTFAVLIVLSFLFAVQEGPRDWYAGFKQAPISTTAHCIYNALLRFWTGEVFLPSDGRVEDGGTWAGRFTLLAIGVQILLAGASYTANLTNFLVRSGFESTIIDVEDAIYQKKRICVLKNKVAILETIYEGEVRYVSVEDRFDILEGMDEGLCDCAILGLEDLRAYHGRGEHCAKFKVGDPVIELPWGLPVSEIYAAPLETLISQMMQNGQWGNITEMHDPESICQEDIVDSETASLEPKHLSGAYVLSAALVFIGMVVSLLSKYAKHIHMSNSALHRPITDSSDSKITASADSDDRPDDSRIEDICTAVANLTMEMASLKDAVAKQKGDSVTTSQPAENNDTLSEMHTEELNPKHSISDE